MVDTGYRQFIVLRHAKTEQVANSDRARVLTSRGRRDARAAGRWLREHDISPEVVLTSPAARARATADLVSAELATPADVRVVEDLYGGSVGDLLEVVATLGDDTRRVAVVGHNPTMAELAHDLQKAPDAHWAQHLPTAGIAVLAVPGDWVDLAPQTAELTHWHVPRG
jgi:phosphohistidine phosphatase